VISGTPRPNAQRDRLWRSNVAERIDRFLNNLGVVRRLPNRRELFWLRDALVNLEQGQYPEGEDAMDKAERTLAIPAHAAKDPGTNVSGQPEHKAYEFC
jgi:hypothetical protein